MPARCLMPILLRLGTPNPTRTEFKPGDSVVIASDKSPPLSSNDADPETVVAVIRWLKAGFPMKWISLALALLFSSVAGVANADCSVAGTHRLVQSNNITVTLDLTQSGQTVRGRASFYSTAYHATISGRVEGRLIDRDLRLRIKWYYSSRKSGFTATYDETGIYNGKVDNRGQLKGDNYPFNRPNARTTWFISGSFSC